MANEYKCDICGAPATVHITKIIDGKKVKIHLCSSCAEKASLDAFGVSSELFPKLKELEEALTKSAKINKGSDYCPTCGAKLSEIEKGARFSCQDCYAAIASKLFGMLSQMHGATSHKGKLPKYHVPNVNVSALSDSDSIDDKNPSEEKVENTLDITSIINETEQEISPDIEADVKVESVDSAPSAQTLRQKLEKAISEERYEDAAKLRDQLKTLSE